MSRIAACVIATGSASAGWFAIEAIHDAWLAGARSLLHPSRALLHPMGTAVVSIASAGFFLWAAITNYPWETDGYDIDDLTRRA